MIIKDEKQGIIYKKWQAGSPKGVLLLVYGLGAHSSRWDEMAEYFRKRDISSYALELKGFGETGTLRGHIDSFETYFDDIDSLFKVIERENPGVKKFIVGESMGGLISFLYAANRDNRDIGSLICLSPAFRSRLKLKFTDYIKFAFALLVLPHKQFKLPFGSSMCTRDGASREKMNGESKEHRLATSKLVFNIFKGQLAAPHMAHRISTPVFFLLSGNDRIVDPLKSQKVFNAIEAVRKEIKVYPQMFHSLSVDIGRERVFKDINDWIVSLK
jgi:alpha-beta hydrolase superfamily lysophospholipase